MAVEHRAAAGGLRLPARQLVERGDGAVPPARPQPRGLSGFHQQQALHILGQDAAGNDIERTPSDGFRRHVYSGLVRVANSAGEKGHAMTSETARSGRPRSSSRSSCSCCLRFCREFLQHGKHEPESGRQHAAGSEALNAAQQAIESVISTPLIHRQPGQRRP